MVNTEPMRTSPYSNDLRWRIVYQREGLMIPYNQVAQKFCVGVSAVCRVVRKFQSTGQVDKVDLERTQKNCSCYSSFYCGVGIF